MNSYAETLFLKAKTHYLYFGLKLISIFYYLARIKKTNAFYPKN